jgi:hypothetical protein
MKLCTCILLIYFCDGVISTSPGNSPEFDALLARLAVTEARQDMSEKTIESLKSKLSAAEQQIQVDSILYIKYDKRAKFANDKNTRVDPDFRRLALYLVYITYK